MSEKLIQNFLVFWKIRRSAAPGRFPWTFFYRSIGYHLKFRRKSRPTNHGLRFIGPEQAAAIPDNSADYEIFSYAFEGLIQVKSIIADKTPTAFILWHHGAQAHAEYAMAQVLPETAYFSSYVFQYGNVFTYAMYKAKTLSLLKMQRFLRDGRPVCFHIDGPPLGETISVKIFGVPADLSAGPIKVMQSVKGIRVIPVTSYYKKNKSVTVFFHTDFPAIADRPDISTRDLAASLIRFFEKDQRQRAPEQVMWWFPVKRVLHLEKIRPE